MNVGYFSGSNLILKGALDDYGSGNPINFASWMQYATIPMIINFFLCWLWLQMFYLGFPKRYSKSCITSANAAASEAVEVTDNKMIQGIRFNFLHNIWIANSLLIKKKITVLWEELYKIAKKLSKGPSRGERACIRLQNTFCLKS